MPESIGQQLKKARSERGIAIEQAAQNLHIRQAYLEALENDRRDALPSPVQAKGFLRLYASYLGLPLQSLLDTWDGKSSQTVEKPSVETLQVDISFTPTSPQPESQSFDNAPAPEKQPIEAPSPGFQHAQTAQETFSSIGRQLKSRRQILGLSLEEVERYTHVRQHYLLALEEGRITDLPSTVQGRGMLINYSRFLNLDVDEILSQFAEGLQDRRQERLESSQTAGTPRQVSQPPPKKKAPSRSFFSPNLILGSLLALIVLGFGLWTAAQVDALQRQTKAATPLSIADVLLSKPAITDSMTATPSPHANLSTLAPGEASAGKPLSSAVTPITTLTIPISGNAPLQVYVVAIQRAYLRITVDNKVVFDGRVIPGNAYTFSGEKKIELLTGSAAAIQVYFNQRNLGEIGLVGQVKSLVFTKDGAVTPTSPFTATPTRTQQPSATLRPSPTSPTATITAFIP